MIDKSGEYWHLYFNEDCDDKPEQVLALIEKLFAEIKEMGDLWYVRSGPIVERATDFESGVPKAVVHCRFSSKPPVKQEETRLMGLAKAYR
jgi:hypothetical protein